MLNDRPVQVLIAGGGIAALELLLAVRVLAGAHVAITLLTADAQLAPRAMTVAEPFGRGGAQTYEWSLIARDQAADLVVDRLVAVDTTERVVFTHGGQRLHYDILAVATGALRVEPFAGALTFGARADAASKLRALVAGNVAQPGIGMAFALPSPSTWPLPLYELALLTAQELREYGSTAAVRIVTPEEHPLGMFGATASDAVGPMIDALGIELITGSQPRGVVAGGLRCNDGTIVAADCVITLADVVARSVPGLPVDRAGFIPVDLHGRVTGEPVVYAAGEVTSYPLRQGGLAAQQADAVAEAIAAACGAGGDPAPFAPVLRGRLLTSGAPLYLQSRPSGQSDASTRALWEPPEKIAGRYLAPYLATARPPRIATAPLGERVPALAGATRGDRHAITLALALADAEERHGNGARALQAREAALALGAATVLC
ncbi:MAG TPA: FAD/NAD(P)-binding oxidoreductase [Solirubrobacteraceae bacterium]|nr:FAD/NAD(P)-binding oxidoreductase [Solirubrobacteraceae bacterium]